ncbi:hypothetical protein PN36_09325 [Candidatus Thiomargarita nelsonii]|uniref:Initiator Rep protein WH1 domain-containing protein n=1 Tax=Candidatus Thiomargarita nelsonii TaxID=1003181 RepID=A0A0A6P883_9GAMM|nr:hypothetical protein PN36_09325 [Candidatus Thiomargarita nelsonii]
MIEMQKTTDIQNLVDIIKIDEQKLVVTQANALARSAQEMTLQEKRLLLLAISQIRQNDQKFVKYRIPITTIKNYLDIETKAVYKRTQEITEKLMSRVLHIDDENGNWEKFQWVSYCKYFSKKQSEIGEACIEIQIHEHLRPMLLNLRKHFGSVPLLQIAPMPSVNSIRVFEILWFSSMKLIKTQLSFWLDSLKKRLSLENKYTNFRDFRRDILQRAQKDCAKYSPLIFTWEEEKKGRKIVRLHFTLQGNAKYNEPPALPDFILDNTSPVPQIIPEQPNSSTPPHNDAFDKVPSNYKLLEEQGIADEKIQELIAHHSTNIISNNIKLIRQKHAVGKIPDGQISSWTIKAIIEDWYGENFQKTPFEETQDAKQKVVNKQKRQADEKQKERLTLEKRFNEEKSKAIDALLNDERFKANNLADEQAEFLKQHIEGIPILNKIYLKSGFDAPMIIGPFRNFVANIYLPAYSNLVTWCARNNIDLEKFA